MEEFSKTGRKLRPRKTEKVAYGEHRQSSENRNFSGRKPYGSRPEGERSSRPEGERRSFGEHRPYGEHRSSNGEHRPSSGEHRSFSGRKPYGNRPEGERSSRPEGEHRSFGERRSFGEHRPYGERRSSNGEHRPSSGEHRSFSGRKPFGNRPRFKHNDEPHFSHVSDEGINRMIERRPSAERSYNAPRQEVSMEMPEEMRLNKFIANSGVCSRREADTFILAGVVTVNGEVVTELGTKINILNDDVRFNGERLKGEEKVYIVMNKPGGYVTTSSDPHAERTVMDLLNGCEARVFPVGRLDKNTTGVLMFTNDGEISERLTHPSFNKKKIYQVIVDHPLSQEDYDKILSGITLTDGDVNADELEYIDENDHRKLGIEIHSGKNRIVRRIFESLGYEVKALDRVYFAGLTKKGLKKGEWRFLTEGEVNLLKMGAYV